ncbi:MAG: hypothetical protein RMK94_13715 [Armatimonadota bacterium]|nr:hypothetical protein [Armatimonadota bacterium]
MPVKTIARRLAFFCPLCLVAIVGVWWWIWQAPYRTLTIFINALYTEDIKTIYNLIPEHERRYKVVTPELIKSTYSQFLKPFLLKDFPRYHLIQIQKDSDRPRSLIFYLRFKNQERLLLIYLSNPPGRQGWKVPFSYFVWLNAKLYGDADTIMRQIGYKHIATPEGGVFSIKEWWR